MALAKLQPATDLREPLTGPPKEKGETTLLERWSLRLLEFARALVPLALLVALYCYVAAGEQVVTASIVGGLGCVITGLALFKYGLLTGVMPFAESLGTELPRRQAEAAMLVTMLVLGVVVTFAEPGIDSLQLVGSFYADAPPILHWLLEVHPGVLMGLIAGGVGLAAAVGTLRIQRQWPLSALLVKLLPVLLVLSVFAKGELAEVVPLAWDSGCITTGPATVPIVLSMGSGLAAAARRPGDAGDGGLEGFGVVTLASLFPVLTVLLGGYVLNEFDHSVDSPAPFQKTQYEDLAHVVMAQVQTAGHSIGPLVAFLLLLQAAVVRAWPADLERFLRCSFVAFLGLAVFNVGMQYGSLPLGDSAGAATPRVLADHPGNDGVAFVCGFGFLAGLIATFVDLEPCGLGEKVEELTCRRITKAALFVAVALGVGAGIALGFLRLLADFSLLPVLVGGYSVCVLLSLWADPGIVCVAWDAAGVTTGPITVPLVLSVGVGIADSPADAQGVAFGILACAPPLCIACVLLLGLWKLGVKA